MELVENREGYLEVKDTRELFHRKVYKQKFTIPHGFEVHHCDGNKLNNELENLIALPKYIHQKIHRLQRLQCTIFKKFQIKEMLPILCYQYVYLELPKINKSKRSLKKGKKKRKK